MCTESFWCSHGDAMAAGAGVGAAPMPWDLAQHGMKCPDAWIGWVLKVVFLTCCLPCSCPAGLKGIAGGAGLDLTPIERGKHGGGTVSALLDRVAGSASPVVLSRFEILRCERFAFCRAGVGTGSMGLLIPGELGSARSPWEKSEE